MSRKPKMLNVRKHLEFEIWLIDEMETAIGKGKLQLAPFYLGALREVRFFAKAILRKHAAKGTRKDVYVETKGGNV